MSALAGGGLTAAVLGGPLATLAQGESAWTPVVTATGSATTTTTTTEATPPTSVHGAGKTGAAKETDWEAATTSTTSGTHTTTTTLARRSPAAELPAVVQQREQKATSGEADTTSPAGTVIGGTNAAEADVVGSNVAEAPQVVAAQLGGLEEELAGTAVTSQALSFYRIPLFLLPIYQAAAVQYGVPWQILAAINEIETDYGNDLSVSTAGAVGWMQFMPSTWLQYGVDALDTGYADPYNPVDAVFAAARYLKAAGAAKSLSGAIFSYNHSEAYVQSVLLRAKLISAYPGGVIATLTGLTDGRLPVTGGPVSWGEPTEAQASTPTGAATASSATANARQLASAATATSAATAKATAVAPSTAAAAASAASKGSSDERVFVNVMTAPNAHVVAVQDGRITSIGVSRKLGSYVILRDVYGDVFTYAGIGKLATTYVQPKAPRTVSAPATGTAGEAASEPPTTGATGSSGSTGATGETSTGSTGATGETSSGSTEAGGLPAPANALQAANTVQETARAIQEELAEVTPIHASKLFSLAPLLKTTAKTHASKTNRLPLRVGALVSQGTVLGRVDVPHGAKDGHLRFAIRPDGDPRTINPSSVLSSWEELHAALYPQGAKAQTELLGATTSGVFLLSKSGLERTVLADPGITMPACARQAVAAGRIDKRVLAVLAYLSRSGLRPTADTLACSDGAYAKGGYVSASHLGDALAITAINGIRIAGHQGAGSVTDTTIRALLTLQGDYEPHEIVSLMRIVGAPNTHARHDHGKYIEVVFQPVAKAGASRAIVAAAAHSAGAGSSPALSPLAVGGSLSSAQWEQLIARVHSLPKPKIASAPSKSAIPDKQPSRRP